MKIANSPISEYISSSQTTNAVVYFTIMPTFKTKENISQIVNYTFIVVVFDATGPS